MFSQGCRKYRGLSTKTFSNRFSKFNELEN